MSPEQRLKYWILVVIGYNGFGVYGVKGSADDVRDGTNGSVRMHSNSYTYISAELIRRKPNFKFTGSASNL